MSESQEQPIQSLDETGPRKGKAYAERMVRMVRNYVARCRDLNEPKDRMSSQQRALEQEREAVLSNLRRLGVHDGWLTHNGTTPDWLKLVDDSQEVIDGVVAKQRRVHELSHVGKLNIARQAFLEGVSLGFPPIQEENFQLLEDLRLKYETAQLMLRLANAIISKL